MKETLIELTQNQIKTIHHILYEGIKDLIEEKFSTDFELYNLDIVNHNYMIYLNFINRSTNKYSAPNQLLDSLQHKINELLENFDIQYAYIANSIYVRYKIWHIVLEYKPFILSKKQSIMIKNTLQQELLSLIKDQYDSLFIDHKNINVDVICSHDYVPIKFSVPTKQYDAHSISIHIMLTDIEKALKQTLEKLQLNNIFRFYPAPGLWSFFDNIIYIHYGMSIKILENSSATLLL